MSKSSSPKSLHRAVCLAAIASLSLAACGGDDDESGDSGGDGGPSGDAVEVVGTGSLAFEPDSLEAPAGAITFRLVNDGSVPHTLLIEDHESDLKLSVTSDGDADDGTLTLEEGDYVFYCDVSGHRGAGMEGSLTVGPPEP